MTGLVVDLGLSAENRSPNLVYLKGGFGTQLHFTMDSPENSTASDRDGVHSVDLDLRLGLFPNGSFSIDTDTQIGFQRQPDARVVTPEGSNDPIDFEGAFDRLRISVGPDLRFRPGSGRGRAFELRLGYRFQGVRFLDGNADTAERDGHRVQLLTLWKFFPKTAAFADISYSIIDYPLQNDGKDLNGNDLPSRNVDSTPFEAALGVRGLVTQRLSTELRAGFIHTFNDEPESKRGPTGRFSLEYKLEPAFSVRTGYQLGVRPTAFANYYQLHHVFADLRLYLLSRISITGGAAYQIFDFDTSNSFAGAERSDPTLIANAGLSYEFFDWLSAGLTWRLTRNFTDFEIERSDGTNPLAFSKQVFSLTVRADY